MDSSQLDQLDQLEYFELMEQLPNEEPDIDKCSELINGGYYKLAAATLFKQAYEEDLNNLQEVLEGLSQKLKNVSRPSTEELADKYPKESDDCMVDLIILTGN